jgi:hypothetical protein
LDVTPESESFAVFERGEAEDEGLSAPVELDVSLAGIGIDGDAPATGAFLAGTAMEVDGAGGCPPFALIALPLTIAEDGPLAWTELVACATASVAFATGWLSTTVLTADSASLAACRARFFAAFDRVAGSSELEAGLKG